MIIYHMAHRGAWRSASTSGRPYHGSADDVRDGFIHFSTAKQIVTSAAKHRAGQADLLLVAVQADALGDALRWEAAASRQGAAFPHLYAPLSTSQAIWTAPLPWDAAAACHVFPPDFPLAQPNTDEPQP